MFSKKLDIVLSLTAILLAILSFFYILDISKYVESFGNLTNFQQNIIVILISLSWSFFYGFSFSKAFSNIFLCIVNDKK